MEDRKRIDNPTQRFRLFLESNGWWNADAEAELKDRLKKDVMQSFKKAEKVPRGELSQLFTDVYAGEQPWNLVSHFLLRSRVANNQDRGTDTNDVPFIFCRRSNERSYLAC